MRYWTRRHGSQRESKHRTAEFEFNVVGSGGLPVLIFNIEGVYHYFEPESMYDVRQLMSHAHIVHMNFKEIISE